MAEWEMGKFLLQLSLLGVLLVSLGSAQDGDNSPCSLTFTIPKRVIQEQCTASQSAAAVQEIRQEFASVQGENSALRAELSKLRKDYEGMVDTVKKLEKETASWRTIVNWPALDEPFTPDNISLIVDKSKQYADCTEVYRRGNTQKGIYKLKPADAQTEFYAFCDEEGYTVFLRRFDGSVDFFRPWSDYSGGFGELSGEFWLGLEYVHHLTKDTPQELKVEAVGWDKKQYTEVYPNFQVGSEKEGYTLHVGNATEGNGGNVLAVLDGMGFSTRDQDHDVWGRDNCANYYRGAWWLQNCGFDPNREWCEGRGCMSWGDDVNIKKIMVKMRPSSARGLPVMRPRPQLMTSTTTTTTRRPYRIDTTTRPFWKEWLETTTTSRPVTKKKKPKNKNKWSNKRKPKKP